MTGALRKRNGAPPKCCTCHTPRPNGYRSIPRVAIRSPQERLVDPLVAGARGQAVLFFLRQRLPRVRLNGTGLAQPRRW